MGGCASKNKQPKEEAYKPASPPSAQPEFEEIVPVSKAVVETKPAMKLNGSVAEGDKRNYRNSLVGPGGVILANHPEVKDETDPSIPYIDASEDELEDEPTPSRSTPKAVEASVEATVEAVTVAGVESVAPAVSKASEQVEEVSKDAEELKVPAQVVEDVVEKVAVANVLNSVEVHQEEVAKPEVQLPEVNEVKQEPVINEVLIPEPEVDDVPTGEDKDVSALGISDTGGSLVDEVMRDVGSGFLSSKESYPIDVEAVTDTARQEANEAEAAVGTVTQDTSEAASSLLTSGQAFAEQGSDIVQGSLQNGFAAAEETSKELDEVAAPVVDGVQGFDVDKAFNDLINSNDQEGQPEFTFDDSAEKKLTSRGLNILIRGSLSPSSDPSDKVMHINASMGTEDEKEFNGFRLAKEEETDCVASPDLIAKTSESVGVVYSPFVMGVGFRVGERHIMTAYHIIREILDKISAQGVTDPEHHILSNKEVWIQFDYIQMGEYEFDNLTRFRFASIPYVNQQLDVAVVELEEHEMKTLPPPLVNFCGIGKRHKVEFVGHDPAAEKRNDPVPLALQPTISEIQKAGEWCQSQGFPPRGYDGLKDMTKKRFRCAPQRASSGTPGVVTCDDEVYVVVLLTKGYPSFYLDVDERQQDEIPTSFKLVEATSMTDVYMDMKGDDVQSELCNSIFGITVTKQQS